MPSPLCIIFICLKHSQLRISIRSDSIGQANSKQVAHKPLHNLGVIGSFQSLTTTERLWCNLLMSTKMVVYCKQRHSRNTTLINTGKILDNAKVQWKLNVDSENETFSQVYDEASRYQLEIFSMFHKVKSSSFQQRGWISFHAELQNLPLNADKMTSSHHERLLSSSQKRKFSLHTQMLSNKDVDNFVNFKTENYGHTKILFVL